MSASSVREGSDRSAEQGGEIPTLFVVIAATRPGRAGEPVARWFFDHAAGHGGFRPELIDGEVDAECRMILLALLLPKPQGDD